MKEQWINRLHARLNSEGEANAPKDLLGDIKAEMNRRGVAPAQPKPQHARMVPIWVWRSASVAAVVACGWLLWNTLLDQSTAPRQIAGQLPQTSHNNTNTTQDVLAASPVEAETASSIHRVKAYSALASGRKGSSAVRYEALSALSGGADLAEPAMIASADQPIATDQSQPPPPPSPPQDRRGAASPNGRKHSEASVAGRNLRSRRYHPDGSQFSVATSYGGSTGASSSSAGILLAAADPIGEYDADFSSNNRAAYMTSRGKTAVKVKHRQPVKLGIQVRYNIDDRWSIQAGISYSYLSSDFTHSDGIETSVTSQKLHYVGVPVAVGYSFWKNKHINVYATAGGEVEKLVQGEIATEGKSADIGTTRSTSVKESRLQFSVKGAIGAEYSFVKGISAYVEPGISHHFNNGSGVDNLYKEKPTNFNLNIGLRIDINR